MLKPKFLLTFLTLISLVFSLSAKTKKVDEIVVVQNQINQAYKQGYVDAAPLEMSFIEKKVIKAKEARDKRKKKEFSKLIAEIKVDLKIVKKRFEVNELHKTLSKLQQENIQSNKMLHELKGQL